jgi:hypothetical protein
LRDIEARLGINRERRMRRPFCWFWLVPAISECRHRYVKGAEECRLRAETRVGGDQQNGDGQNGQYDLDASKPGETVSCPMCAG